MTHIQRLVALFDTPPPSIEMLQDLLASAIDLAQALRDAQRPMDTPEKYRAIQRLNASLEALSQAKHALSL